MRFLGALIVLLVSIPTLDCFGGPVEDYWEELIRDIRLNNDLKQFEPELINKKKVYQQWLAEGNHLQHQRDLDGLWLLDTKDDKDTVIQIIGPLIRQFPVTWSRKHVAGQEFPVKCARAGEAIPGWLEFKPVQSFSYRFTNGIRYEITLLRVGLNEQRRLSLTVYRTNGTVAPNPGKQLEPW